MRLPLFVRNKHWSIKRSRGIVSATFKWFRKKYRKKNMLTCGKSQWKVYENTSYYFCNFSVTKILKNTKIKFSICYYKNMQPKRTFKSKSPKNAVLSTFLLMRRHLQWFADIIKVFKIRYTAFIISDLTTILIH